MRPKITWLGMCSFLVYKLKLRSEVLSEAVWSGWLFTEIEFVKN